MRLTQTAILGHYAKAARVHKISQCKYQKKGRND